MSQFDLSRKRKRGDKVFKFKAFGARGYPAGSFLENIRALLETNPMSTWSFQPSPALCCRRACLLLLYPLPLLHRLRQSHDLQQELSFPTALQIRL
ncbi:PHD finger protein MALE STERILITY 1-like [Salvia divinorum]|uniref:PHD finger protein MALE STERILITY 1-like n=1 Tax=Salvia divinorum TaxID=28513 RepID=A0ABD1HSL5_SALDI